MLGSVSGTVHSGIIVLGYIGTAESKRVIDQDNKRAILIMQKKQSSFRLSSNIQQFFKTSHLAFKYPSPAVHIKYVIPSLGR